MANDLGNTVRRVRMKDIAADLGLSVVTVSKVFRGRSDIGDETRGRVLARMAELNYQPNVAARSLATGRSYTMGFVVPDLMHPFFAEIAKYMAGVLRTQGYHLMMSSSLDEAAVEADQLEHLLNRGVDLLMVASSQVDPGILQPVLDRNVPLILVDRQFPGFLAHFVGVDDRLTGCLATRHLVEQGYRRIAHIGPMVASTAAGRAAGYREALAEAGLTIAPEHVQATAHGDDSAEDSGYDAMQRLLAVRPQPDAVFCFNDPTAIGAMKAILEAGLRIPQDMAVVGCGNIRNSDFLTVPLTTIDQDGRGIGLKTAQLALSLVEQPSRRRTILLEQRLISRASSLRMPR